MPEVPAADGMPPASVNEDRIGAGSDPLGGERPAAGDPQQDQNQEERPQMPEALPSFMHPRVTPAIPAKPRWKAPAWMLVCAGLLVGLLAGVLIMHQRALSRAIIVSVNGTSITEDELLSQLQAASAMPMMRKMVENELQLQFAQKKGLAPTDAQVNAEFAKISQRPDYAQALVRSGLTESDLKRNLRVQLAQTAVISQGITVTDADARRYYQAQSDPANPTGQFYRPAAVSLRAISSPNRVQADRALAELGAQTPFELVASSYSTDGSKTNGGLLAPIALGRSPMHRDPALEKSVFGMKIGDQIGPVFFANQWWIFKCQDKAPAATVPYDQVKDQCFIGAKLIKGAAVNSKTIQKEFLEFQRTSSLQAFWPQYQKAIALH